MAESLPDYGSVGGDWDSIPGLKRFSHNAMATVFDVFILYEDARYAEQAAWAAFDELDRLEAQLSRYIENSDISRIASLPANQPLRVGLAAFECLQSSVRIYGETNGAFDVTIGSLFDCLLNKDKTPRSPSKQELEDARRRTGANLLVLDESEHTVKLLTEGVRIDLGGIGKGYAADKMAAILRQWGIDTAFISAGKSTVLPIGIPSAAKGWPVTMRNPRNADEILAKLSLRSFALSGSGLAKGRHIIDPRSAVPVSGKIAAWASAPDAAAADALSTAFMVMSPDEVKRYCTSHPGTIGLVVVEKGKKGGEMDVLRFGSWDDAGQKPI
jgi:thiamine biosynthesis lipoprotein